MDINYDLHPGVPLKYSKKSITRFFKDQEGNLWGLHKDANLRIAVLLIQKELKYHYVGELYGIDHDEWKRLVYGGLWKEVTR